MTVPDYDAVQIFGKADGDYVGFIAMPGNTVGISTGTLNRVTGALSVHIITYTDGLQFYGTCRPPKRLP